MTDLNNIVEILAKQALGNSSQQNQGDGLGGILGSVLGQLGGGSSSQANAGGLGGILGSVLGQLGGGQSQSKASAGGASQILIAVLPLVLAWIQKQGGLQGALDQLKGLGLTSQVEDWVSTGPGENASVGVQQIQKLFSESDVAQVAEQVQAPTQDVYSAISTVLPQIIDSLTPQGDNTSSTEANSDIANVLNMVSGFLK